MSTRSKTMKSTRKRARNYTTEEEVLLVELVGNHKSDIENKKSDAVIWRQKEEAWKKVEKQFAETIGTHRHWKALRDKYETLKRKSRSEMTNLNSETYSPSGGVATARVSGVSAKIASLLGDSATGPQNSTSSDYLIEIHDENGISNVDRSFETDSMSNIKQEESASTDGKPEMSQWAPTALKQLKARRLIIEANRKRCIEAENMKLVLLQQQFFKDENIRAQEKHEQELLSLKLKNEILQLELAEKKLKFI